MQVGLVGLGRMGAGLRARWRAAGHEVVGYDLSAERRDVDSVRALVSALAPPRVVWLMVPHAATEQALAELTPLLSRGDIVVDGGNSHYRESRRRAEQLVASGVAFLDVGTSGGVAGERHGYCLMVGGPGGAFATVQPLLRALAAEGGYAHLGGAGAGHFAKMVHNAIEYGLLEAYAEGFELLARYDEPLRLDRVAALWNRGSVVRSWLLELAAEALADDPALARLRGYVEDSGEGRWAAQEAVELGVATPVLAQALFARFASRDDNPLSMRLIAALRQRFGGHATR